MTPVDDSAPDGVQQTTIEATAAGYATGSALMNVEDDDAIEVLIMDNSESGYSSNGFRYNTGKRISEAYGGDNESLKGGADGDEATWTFTGLTDGVYHVSATWNHKFENNYNTLDAVYTLTNGTTDEVLSTATANQKLAPDEFLDSGIGWSTLDTVTVTGGELVVGLTPGSNPNKYTIADAIRIARADSVGGLAATGAFYDPLEDTLDDLASDWAETQDADEHGIWGE